MDVASQIAQSIDDPAALEELYRAQPADFRREFGAIFAAHPDSVVLQVWQARLAADEDAAPAKPGRWPRDLAMIIGLALLSGTVARIPFWFGWAPDQQGFWYARNLSFTVLPGLAAYFLMRSRWPRGATIGAAAAFLLSAVAINILPDASAQTVILSQIHLPFFLWTVLGLAYVGTRLRDASRRMDYLRYNGEVIIYTGLFMIGGVVLSGLAVALFQLVKIFIDQWYVEWVGIYGAVGCVFVATYVVEVVSRARWRIAPLLATVFSPLFLILLVSYSAVILVQGKSPYTDRDFLITFNAMLLIVLAITVFTISERRAAPRPMLSDYITASLALVALALNAVALSAIVYRLASFGFTPNRIAVLGANIVVFAHLVGLFVQHVRFLARRGTLEGVERWVAGYLPVYAAWTAVVAFLFPLIFGYGIV